MTVIEKKESVAKTGEVLNMLLNPKVEEPVVTPPIVTPPVNQVEVILVNNERIPSSWKLLPAEGGKIEAQCGGHYRVCSMDEFNAMIATGKYTK